MVRECAAGVHSIGRTSVEEATKVRALLPGLLAQTKDLSRCTVCGVYVFEDKVGRLLLSLSQDDKRRLGFSETEQPIGLVRDA